MDTSGLVEAYRQGKIEPGALVWREGMDRWLPPYDVPEIAAALHRAGVTVPGSDLGASFDDDEEATRVALSPLLPRATGGSTTDLAAAFDDEVTRAIDSSPNQSFDDDEVTRAIDSAPNQSFDDDEVTRAIDSSPRSTFDGEEEPTRIYDPEPASAAVEPRSPRPPGAAPPPPPPPPRPPTRPAAPSAASAPVPPTESLHPDPTPFLDSLPIDDTSDISGLEEPLTRPPTAQLPSAGLPGTPPVTVPPLHSRKRGWIVASAAVGLLLALALGVSLLRPEWVASARQQVAVWLGRESPAATTRSALPPFDAARAGVLLEEAATTAQRCKLPDGPVGPGRVHVRYGNDGRARSAQVSEPFAGTEVGECVSAVFTKTRVAPFSGKEVIVAKTFVIE